jgi:hypothetical protein
MKTLPTYVWLVVAGLIVLGLLWTGREGFIPQVDKSQEMRTRALEESSYAQTTNHFEPSGVQFGPVIGISGKDQVNQWKGVVV